MNHSPEHANTVDVIADASLKIDAAPLGMNPLECGAIPENSRKSKRGGARIGAGRPKQLPPPLAVGPHWYCAQIYPWQEDLAESSLVNAKLRVFQPKIIMETVRHRGRRRVADTVIRPAFPGYLFVELDLADGWQRAAYARGVRRLFGSTPERPTPVPIGIVEAMQMRVDSDGIMCVAYDGPRLAAIQVGDRVQILDGPFADLTGLCMLSERDRIRVLVDTLTVVVDRKNVIRAE